ncbi:MAG TPA: PEGA domain-containing protein [Polyangiaceae bacterium]|jgi:hypothetical protein
MRRSSDPARSFLSLLPFRVCVAALGGAVCFGWLAPDAAAADKPAAAPAKAKAGKDAKDEPGKPDKKTRDAARAAFGDAEKAYAAGDFQAAFDHYRKANDLIPAAAASYKMAKCLDQLGKTDDAIKAYDALFADPGIDKLSADKLDDAKARLADLKSKQVGQVSVTTNPAGATVSVDGVAQMGETPMVLKLAPGEHTIKVVEKEFEAKELKVDVKVGDKSEQKLDLVPLPLPAVEPAAAEPAAAPATAPPAAPASTEPPSKVPAYVTLGIATAGAIVGTIFGVQALQNKSDFDKNPTTKKADDTERSALIADMAFGVAVTLGVTGIVLLTSGGDDSTAAPKNASLKHLPKKATLTLAPYAGPKSAGAAALLNF